MAVSKQPYMVFILKGLKNSIKQLLTTAKYLTISYMSVASQSKGLKCLLIYFHPKP